MMSEIPKYICYRVTVENVTIGGRKMVLKEVSPEEVAEDLRPVVRGRWSAETSEGASKWKCSCCGGSALLDDYEMMVTSAFCPHCGARMEGAEGE